MKPALYVIPVLAITVFLLVRAEILGKQRQIYILKPISTLLVIAAAAFSLLEPAQNPIYIIGVLAGLLLSFGGDMTLMLKNHPKAFTRGLVLFLLAHVAYTVVFMLLGTFSVPDLLSAGLLLLAGIMCYHLFRPNLGKMKIPVMAYIVIISVMVNRAAAAFTSPVFSATQGIMIFFGALLFYISDIILAANRFWKPWPFNRVSLAFYYSGQLLIALAASYFV